MAPKYRMLPIHAPSVKNCKKRNSVVIAKFLSAARSNLLGGHYI